MIRPRTLNLILILVLLAVIAAATLANLSTFAAVSNADGQVLDMRGIVLLDIRWPRISLALLAGGPGLY